MHLEKYAFEADNIFENFVFDSIGPNGVIRKAVRYTRMGLLATVAATVLTFNECHGQFAVYAKGATAVRTRLYQMGINANLPEIEAHFFVYGFLEGIARPFRKGVNYQAFLVIKKG